MPILSATTSITGMIGIIPNFVFIQTNDTAATVTTAGYLTKYVHLEGLTLSNYDIAFVSILTNNVPSVLILQVTITGLPPNQVYSLVPVTNPGGAIFAGNVQAGSNGIAGGFLSFPATLNTGHMFLFATANGGAFNTLITNAALAQTTTFTIPDPGVAAASFLLNNNAGTQTIATGNLALTLGSFQTLAGNILAGSSGNAGTLASFPTTAARGSLILAAVANTGNTTTTISNVAMGQASVISIPDPANAIGRFLIGATATPFTANHSLVASGTGGLIADAGYQQKVVAQAAVAGGAAAQTVNDAFCTAASMVTASWNDTTNAVTIQKVTAGNGSFVVTSSGDPGASHLNYIITKV